MRNSDLNLIQESVEESQKVSIVSIVKVYMSLFFMTEASPHDSL